MCGNCGNWPVGQPVMRLQWVFLLVTTHVATGGNQTLDSTGILLPGNVSPMRGCDSFMTVELTSAQLQFIHERSSGRSIVDAAKIAGVSEQTAHRWLKLPLVQEALAGTRQEIKESAREVIIRHYTKALDASCQVVVQVAMDSESPAAARLKAVQMIQDRVAPVVTDVTTQNDAPVHHGIDWSIFTEHELSIIQPIFAQAEERRRIEQGETTIPQLRKQA